MSKYSALQYKKLQELEYNQNLQEILAKNKPRKKARLIENMAQQQASYYNFARDSGGEYLCLFFRRNDNNKLQEALKRLTKTLLQKGWDSWLNDSRVAEALTCVAKHENSWLQTLDNYRPISHNPYREFAHLLRFLFARYPLPVFLDTAFYAQNDLHIAWYLHLGRGGSVRNMANLPIDLNKKMRHYFLQAPAEATIPQAFRYAQVLALDGSRRLAETVMQTNLGTTFENGVFWESVIRFLAQNPMLDVVHVAPIIGFLQWVKFEEREVWNPTLRRNVQIGALEPAFSMKGRTAPALLRLVEAWQKDQQEAQNPKAEASQWDGLPLETFEIKTGEDSNAVIYRFKQIHTASSLREEGHAMSHCVATYYSSCVAGNTSIWSLSREDLYGNNKRLLTIEVNRSFRVQQARGHCNRYPSPEEYRLLGQWAQEMRLSFSTDVVQYAQNLHRG